MIADERGMIATFMPKPFNDEGGSGYHLHFSTWSDDDVPLFDDPDGPDGLSEVARQAVAGVLAHAPALAAIDSPHAEVRREAVGVLAYLKRIETLPALTRLAVHDPEPEVRRAAVGALALPPSRARSACSPR